MVIAHTMSGKLSQELVDFLKQSTIDSYINAAVLALLVCDIGTVPSALYVYFSLIYTQLRRLKKRSVFL